MIVSREFCHQYGRELEMGIVLVALLKKSQRILT